MPFSAIDFSTLKTHGLLDLYDKYRDRLIIQARTLFQHLKQISAITPTITDCELELELEFRGSSLFHDIIADACVGLTFPKATDSYWEFFVAGSIARFVVDKEWPYISI